MKDIFFLINLLLFIFGIIWYFVSTTYALSWISGKHIEFIAAGIGLLVFNFCSLSLFVRRMYQYAKDSWSI